MRGVGTYGFVRDLYAVFHGEICPHGGVLVSFAGAFRYLALSALACSCC
jgi:hypothetical protein